MSDELATKGEESFADTPTGWASRWSMEFGAAKKELKAWHRQAKEILKRFRDERDGMKNKDTRLNLFTANVQTLRALLYGKVPQVEVSRRFVDATDDMARVGGEMLERLLNADIERDGDGYAEAIQNALDDRLLAGLGTVWVRYVVETEMQPGQPAMLGPMGEVLAPEVPEQEVKSYEAVETDYVYWEDYLFSPARTEKDVRWKARKAPMTREALIERFGEKVGKEVPLNSKRGKSDGQDSDKANPWDRADVWEIWDKEHKKVFWFVEGFEKVLDQKDDPLGIEGFFPCPRPLLANITTSSLIPRPDFVLAQDVYNEIDEVSTRINLLEKAIRVAGVYDRANEGVKRLIGEAANNELIPVDNWHLFSEKGGVRGAVDWLPLDQIVMAMDKLREYRSELIGLLYQVTGMSDIMRGQATQQTTATEQAIKAKFASVRVQSLQDEFARFASDVQKIKAEIISKHFDPQTIYERSNVQFTPDAQLAPQAIELIKSKFYCYRVQVKPEAVSLTDFAALKQERVEFLQALSGFVQSAMPMGQVMPQAMPMLLQMLQWAMAGFKGSSTIEGVLDTAIAQAQQAAMQPPPPPPPDPRIEAQKMKTQADMMKTKMGLQADLVRINAETQAHNQREASTAHWNITEGAANHDREMAANDNQERANGVKAVERLVNR